MNIILNIKFVPLFVLVYLELAMKETESSESAVSSVPCSVPSRLSMDEIAALHVTHKHALHKK
jgi:hypothetical protein